MRQEAIPELFDSTPQRPASHEELAAIKIQSAFRGSRARRVAKELRYAAYVEEEEAQHRHRLQQLEEGELLLESRRLKLELERKQLIRKAELHELTFHAVV